MKAVITPIGLSPITVEAEDPKWADDEIGGFGDASFSCDLDAYTKTRLHDADVMLGEGDYFGRVKSWDGREVKCKGLWDRLDDEQPYEVCYSDTAVSPWKERLAKNRSPKITVQADFDTLTWVYEDGATISTGAYNGFWREIPVTASVLVKIEWTRPSTATGLTLYASSTADATGGWTNTIDSDAFAPSGSGNTSGTSNITLEGAGMRYLLINATLSTGAAQNGSGPTCKVTVYGEGAVPTPDSIVTDACAQFTHLIPAGTDIGVDAVNELTPAVFADGDSLKRPIERVLDYTDATFRFEARLAGAILKPAAVFKSRDTTIHYSFDANEVDARLAGGDTSPLATHVRVLYTDAAGNPRYVDVEDTDTSHPLVARWRSGGWDSELWKVITADTTSSTNATAVGQTYLALAGREQVKGTLTVKDGRGILAGRNCTVRNTDIGTVTARIRRVEHDGESAVVTLDNTPTIDDLLAAKFKQTQAGRFNYVPLIDRRRS